MTTTQTKIEWMKVIGAGVAILTGFGLLLAGERDFALLSIGAGVGVLIPFQMPRAK